MTDVHVGPYYQIAFCVHKSSLLRHFRLRRALTVGGGGAHPKKNQKKNSCYTKIGKLALVFFGFFWFFFGFFGIGFGHNSKLETVFFLVFFFVFLAFFGFFWHRPWPTFEIGNWFFGLRWFFFGFFWFFLGFFGIFWFFWYLNLGLEYHPKKYQKKPKKTKKNQKKTKKNQKKPKKNQKNPKKTKKSSRYTKIGKLAWFFFLVFFCFFFGFFWGEHPPTVQKTYNTFCRSVLNLQFLN